uniref:Seven TM Receptor n=1 Tax=Caenorhabditis japonica TaxID=281687 RepID=A0A8R1DJB4_CAEJA
MLSFAIFEICYSILDVIVKPTHFSHGTAFIVIVTNSWLSRDTLLFLDGVYAGFFGSSLALFSIHYIYRYLVSIGSQLLKSFNDWRIFFWFCIPLIYGFHWIYLTWVMCPPRNMTTEYVKDAVSASLGFTADKLVYIGPYLYTIEDNGNVTVHLSDMLGAMSLSVGVSSSIFMILYFGVKCYRNLKNMMSHLESQRIRNLQHPLFVALVIQTLIPIVLMHIPSMIVFLAAFMNVSLGSLTGVMCITVALFPAIDPLPTMFIIEEYRRTILVSLKSPRNCFGWGGGSKTSNATNSIAQKHVIAI